MQRSVRRVSSAVALAIVAACSAPPPAVPGNASVGATAAVSGTPPARANDAAPEIVAMHFSALNVKRGERWSGEFLTSTNVASVEVRTPLFSINAPRRTFGRFAFAIDVLDTPPVFVRAYRLEVIARNSAGIQTAEQLPFRIR